MHDFGQLLAFGAGALCLGIALAFGLISALVNRHSPEDGSQSCFGTAVTLSALGVAAYLFFLAITS